VFITLRRTFVVATVRGSCPDTIVSERPEARPVMAVSTGYTVELPELFPALRITYDEVTFPINCEVVDLAPFK
jgi:hypothetical protein